MSDLFPEVVRALSGVENQTERNALATQLFGRNAMELAPMLAAGTGEVDRLSQRAHELGIVLSADMVSGLAEAEDALSEFKMQSKAVSTELGAAFAPTLTNVVLPALAWLGHRVRDLVRGWQMIGAGLATIPEHMKLGFAQMRVTLSRALLHITGWAIEVERLLNRVRIAFGEEELDFTSGMIERVRSMSHDALADVRTARVELERIEAARDAVYRDIEGRGTAAAPAMSTPTVQDVIPEGTGEDLLDTLEIELAGLPPLRIPVLMEPVEAIDLPTGTVTPVDPRVGELKSQALDLAASSISQGGINGSQVGSAVGAAAGMLIPIPGASVITGAVGGLIGGFSVRRRSRKRSSCGLWKRLRPIRANPSKRLSGRQTSYLTLQPPSSISQHRSRFRATARSAREAGIPSTTSTLPSTTRLPAST